MSKINVHVLEFFSCDCTHIEVVLEEQTQEGTLYYNIDRWADPLDQAKINDEECLKLLKDANKEVTFTIDRDMNQIIECWKKEYSSNEGNICCNNCADATAWFLDTFANITNPGSCAKPITCDYLCCGFFAPSFLQACTPTLPGRVMGYVADHIQHETSALLGPKTMTMSKK